MNTCDCSQPGFCPRYLKPMHGRDREICQGVNVDAGEAANLRAQWRLEAEQRGERRMDDLMRDSSLGTRPVILRCHLNAGDALVLTAAIYSLHRKHPDRFITAVDTNASQLFEYNPDVVPLNMARAMGAETVTIHYPAVHQSNESGIHFMQAMCEHLGESLGVDVPLLTNRPRFYFGKDESFTPPASRYWIINAGWTEDFSAKSWGVSQYQAVVDAMKDRVQFVQIGDNGEHPRLTGVFDLVGKTNLRQLAMLTRSASGVLCGLTLISHLAAACEVPSVVIAGGREPVQWNAYPQQHLLHTVGTMKCCRPGACWKSRLLPSHEGDDSVCPWVALGEEKRASCMERITPEEVISRISAVCS